MQQRIELGAALATRVRGNRDGTVILGDDPVSEPGGWMHIPVALERPKGAVIECTVRIRVSVDANANRCLYIEQVEIAGRRFGGIASLGAAFGARIVDSIPLSIVAHLQRCISGRLETLPELAAAPSDVPPAAPLADPGPPRRTTREWGT